MESVKTEKSVFFSGIYSSVSDILPTGITGETISAAKTLNCDTYSFKVAYSFSGTEKRTVLPVFFSIEGDFPIEEINVYKIGNVPIINPVANSCKKDYFVSDTPSLYPDPLYLMSKGTVVEKAEQNGRYFEEGQRTTLNACGAHSALWVEVNPDSKRLPAGKYTIECVFHSLTDNSELSRQKLSLEVLKTERCEQPLKCTNWFYCDSIADVYGVEMFSERHFGIIASYVRTAAKHGSNMILTPAFTPPLDTRVGKQRKTVQLIGVKKEGVKYIFDFSLFEKFVNICLENGIKYFEHSHFFTQWGAGHCPNIMATVDGEYKRIFGWETDAASEEYSSFLRQYVKALIPVLDKLGIKDRIYYHISDEPGEEHLDNYRNARRLLLELLPDIKTIDAMSSYEFYEQGIVDIPVVREISEDMDKFVKDCKEFWIYYTGGVIKDGNANRLITMPQSRNRLLGIHLYVAGAAGFLHWGYNYYYDVLTHGIFNPLCDPCFYFGSPGTSYLVYPSLEGEAIPSQRIKVMREAFGDYTALKMLEEKIGRKKVLALINKTLGREITVRDAVSEEEILRLKDTVISML